MTEDDTRAAASCTDTARARPVMPYEACELAGLARAFVPMGESELNLDGTNRSPGAVPADEEGRDDLRHRAGTGARACSC